MGEVGLETKWGWDIKILPHLIQMLLLELLVLLLLLLLLYVFTT